MRKSWSAALAAAVTLLLLGQAQAADPAGMDSSRSGLKGTFALAPEMSWAREISDGEMQEMRGGYFGFSLSFLWTGSVDNLGNTSATSTEPLIETIGAVDNNVDLSVSLGTNAFNGSSGLISLVNVEGAGNVVESNIFLNLTIITGAQSSLSLQNLINQYTGM